MKKFLVPSIILLSVTLGFILYVNGYLDGIINLLNDPGQLTLK
ncbi:hypothetical protein SAMN04488134_103267 [Amphibacillus marinus]|uniref:Uncharacterized protein n=1 Tax=Amphibacillus marinus TaxID=872970 RepID=A0A1H8LN36_9BACI|nr:hypothetical protein [Amphibacillus marinus]SEO06535.1 hypothetical protein SAMN04488134_103267 [Amphibacillus marinus]